MCIRDRLSAGLDSDKITEIAKSMDLIEEDKTIKINAETSGFEVVDDFSAELTKWTDGRHTVSVDIDESDGISRAEKKLSNLDGKKVEMLLDANDEPASVVIQGLQMKVSDYDSTTGTCLLYTSRCV